MDTKVSIGQFTLEVSRELLYGGQLSTPLRAGQRATVTVFHAKSPMPKYSVLLLDSRTKHSLKQKNLAVFVIPQGQEKAYAFHQETGQQELLESIGSARLLLVTLNHGFVFTSMEEVQTDFAEVARALAPPNVLGQILFTTNGDIGERSLVHLTSTLIIEDVRERDCYLRQLIFLSNVNHIQSEIRILVKDSSDEPLFSENSPAASFGVLEADYSCLTFECQRAQLVSLAFYPEHVLEQPVKVLVLGAGACILPTFLLKYFENLEVVAVDVDASMLELSQTFFNASRSPRMSLVIQDAAEFIQDTQETFDWVLVDISTGTVEGPTPPPVFTSVDCFRRLGELLTERGVLTVNVIATGPETSVILNNASQVFPNVSLGNCIEDTNQTVYCLKDPERASASQLERAVNHLTQVKGWDVTMNLQEYASRCKAFVKRPQAIFEPKKKKHNQKKRRR